MGKVFQIALRGRDMRNFGGGVYPVVVIWQNGVILKMTCVYQWSLKKATGTITTAKMKFLLGYNMKIVGGGGYETLVGNNNLVEGEESIGADFSSEVGGRINKFLACGENPLLIFLGGGFSPVAKTLMDVVRHTQSHPKQQVSYISRMYCFLFVVRYT